MSPLVEDIYTSPPSKFIVDGRVLYVHGQLVSRHSKPLSAKINARTDYTIIDGVDKDTFVRFIEWAYKGYYTAAEYKIDAESPSLSKFEDSDTCTPEAEPALPAEEPALPAEEPALPAEEPALPAEEPAEAEPEATERPLAPAFRSFYNTWGATPPEEYEAPTVKAVPEPVPETAIEDLGGRGRFDKKKLKKSKNKSKSSKETLKESFHAREYSEDLLDLPSPRLDQSPNENYTPIFLSHAHLYIFACKYGIPPLKTLALENLHTTLKEFTLHPERTGDVIELLRYIYSSSSREFKDGGGVGCGDMREMLKGYIGFQMDVLMKDRGFRGLMKEEGELLDDFVEMVGKRI